MPNVSEVPLRVLIIDFVRWLCGPWVAFGHWRTYLTWALFSYLSLIGHLYLSGVWRGDDLRIEPNMTYFFGEEIGHRA